MGERRCTLKQGREGVSVPLDPTTTTPRLLVPLLLLSACGQAQKDEVSEVNGGSFPRGPAAIADAGASGSAAMAPVETGQDGGAPSLDAGPASSPESMNYDSIPEWEAGVPPELAEDTSRCVFTDAHSSGASCQLAIECDPEHNPGRLMSTCKVNPESGEYLCACTWVGENDAWRIFFESDPYPGDNVEPCVISMEACARSHTE